MFTEDNPTQRTIRRAQATALVALPVLWLAMFILHFRSLSGFFTFRASYVPVPPRDMVTRLIAAGNRWPMLHDPHLMGYISLPLLVLAAFGLYAVGRVERPALAALGLSMTVSGTVFLGGVFGLLIALIRGIGDVDPGFTDGAVATYAAVTADHGAYALTRSLAMLSLAGVAVQALALWRASALHWRSPALILAGCAMFLGFWDVDNMMFVGALLLLCGFVPVARTLRQAALRRPIIASAMQPSATSSSP